MFTIGKTNIKFDFTFFAVIGFLVFVDTSGTATLSLVASLVHEAGHLIAMLMCKSKLRSITFYGGGICIKGNIAFLPFYKRLFIVSAGCFVNLFISLIGFIFFADNTVVFIFAIVNGVICAFNLIPIGYFDGAEIVDMLFNRFLNFTTAETLKRIVAVAFSIVIVFFVFLYCFFYAGEISVSFLFVVLYLILAQFVR